MNATTRSDQAMPRTGAILLAFVLLAALGGVEPVRAVDYDWTNTVGGTWGTAANWDPNGLPTASDAAFVTNAGAYTVTVGAAASAGAVTLNNAGATLNAASALTISNAASLLSGTIQGTYTFSGPAVAVTVDKSNVSVGGTTAYQFRRGYGLESTNQVFNGGNLSASETLSILNVDVAGGTRNNLAVTTANGYTNTGTIVVQTNGRQFGGIGNQAGVRYTITSGTLVNQGTLVLTNGGFTSFTPYAVLDAVLLNDVGGTFWADSQISTVGDKGRSVLARSGVTYENRGTWNVTGGYGLQLIGPGTTFTQSTAGAVLNAPGLFLLSNTGGVQNVVSITDGSVQGNFELHKTDLTLGASRTVAGPTLWKLVRDGADGNPAFPPFINYNYVGTLSLDELRSNETLQILNNNTGGAGYRAYTSITQSGGFVNYGTISIQDSMSYHDVADRSELLISGGALTNRGQVQLTDVSSVAADGARLTGQLINETAGTVTLSASASGQTRVGTAGNTHQNRGVIVVAAGTRNFVDGSAITNETTGVIRGTGTNVTVGGSATLINRGTVESIGTGAASTFSLTNALDATTSSGNSLLSGTWRVQDSGFTTVLNVPNAGAGNITSLNGATVILDGANASFTQLESASGRLNSVGPTGALTILNSKNFLATNTLANAGTITVGTGSTLTVGSGGSGVLTNTGILAGSGSIAGDVVALAGTMAPGASPGTLTIDGDHTFGDNSIYEWEIDAFANDVVDVNGLLTFGSGAKILRLIDLGSSAKTNETFVLFEYNSLADANDATNNWSLQFIGGRWITNDPQVFVSGSQLLLTGVGIIPEPGTLLLLALGGLMMMRTHRRRRN